MNFEVWNQNYLEHVWRQFYAQDSSSSSVNRQYIWIKYLERKLTLKISFLKVYVEATDDYIGFKQKYMVL